MKSRVIVAEYMNIRLGKNDLAEDDAEYVVRNLLHDDWNTKDVATLS